MHVDDVADIAVLFVPAYRLKQIAVYTGQPDTAAAGLLQHGDQVLIDLSAQHHLYDIHRFIIGTAQTVEKYAFLADLLQHLADLRSAAVHQHDAHTDQVQQQSSRMSCC